MCGIAGRYAVGMLGPQYAMELAMGFEAALAKRGPDGWSHHRDRDVLLVHRRLAIIDLSPAGVQPLWNEDRTICVIVNGEIYNHRELRARLISQGHCFRSNCDSEVLVHLYEQVGIDSCCAAIEGMFAFVLWDARTRDLYLVRDRLGIKPLVIAEHNGGVTFASTLPALLRDSEVPRVLRDEAFVALMKWGFVPSPWSAVRAARRVEPGTWIRVAAGRVVAQRRWWIDSPKPPGTPAADVRGAIQGAIRSHLVSDVPVGVLLSSGIDSGIVAALAAREPCETPLEAWTVRHAGFEDDEYPGAAQAAAYFGLRSNAIDVGDEGLTEDGFRSVVAGMDEPLAVSSLVGLHALFREIAASRRVILTGDGGDELFGGYDWHRGMPAVPAWASDPVFTWAAPGLAWLAGAPGRIGTLGRVAVRVRRHPASVYLDKLRVTPDDVLLGLGMDSISDDPMERRAEETWERFEGAGTLEQMLSVDRATALVDEMLAKVDSASMSYGVEARVPLLADAVVEAAKGIAHEQKRHGDQGKILLRQWFAQLGPSELATRRKTGFNSPLRKWLRPDRAGYLRDRIASAVRDLGGTLTTEALSARTQFSLAVMSEWRRR
jgi:asparagine synthase (glutamine-hydrolysing)